MVQWDGLENRVNRMRMETRAMSAPEVATERAIVKSKSHVYDNSSWDIMDAEKSGTINIEDLKEDQLPEEFKGKTDAEKNALVAQKQEEREAFQAKIGELAAERASISAVSLFRTTLRRSCVLSSV